MQTPPPPVLSAARFNTTVNNNNKSGGDFNRTKTSDLNNKSSNARTPFQIQNNASHLRSFRSEAQPNRAVSRIDISKGTNTSAKPRVLSELGPTSNQPQTNSKPDSKNYLTSRLASIFQREKPPIVPPVAISRQPPQPVAPQQPTHRQALQPHNAVPTATALKTPSSHSQKNKTSSQNDHLVQARITKPLPTVTPKAAHQPVYPATATRAPYLATATKPAHLKLVQDTRGHNQQGPMATATKAPLSVSQYTQPTPKANDRAAPPMSRAHSESSIKYQITINGKTYKILRKIGSGGSARVYEGYEPQKSLTVAIKIINIGQADQRAQESYFNERSLLTRLRDCRHVVRMYDSEFKADLNELIIVMEKGDADLSQVIDSYFKMHKKGTIDGLFIKFYWRGMVQAVHDIHRQGIVHADLKPVNFILVKNEVKLIDFGIANAIGPEGTSIIRDYQIGTINYMAPESLRNRATEQKETIIKYNAKVDIWSLGCILYNLVYGKPPFDKQKDIVSKVRAITDPNHEIEFFKISDRRLLNCMKSCLRYNACDRPSAEELMNDSYIRDEMVAIAPPSEGNLNFARNSP